MEPTTSEASVQGRESVHRTLSQNVVQYFGNLTGGLQLVETIPDALLIVDGSGIIQLVNAQAEKCFGYGRDHLIGRPIEVLIPERFHERHRDKRNTFLADPRNIPMGTGSGFIGRRKDGSEFPVEISLAPMETADGARIIAICRDVTQQRETAKSTAIFLQHETIIGSILHASLSTISLPEFLGYSLDELLSVSWVALESKGCIFLVQPEGDLMMTAHRGLSPDVLATCGRVSFGKCLCGITALTRTALFVSDIDERHSTTYDGMKPHGHCCLPLLSGGTLSGVITLYVKQGHIWSDAQCIFLKSVADAIAGAIARKKSEDALRKSEERFALAIEGTDAGIWDWDLPSGAVYFSPHWKRMIGYDDHEIRNEYHEWESRLHAEDCGRVLNGLKNYLEGKTLEYDTEFRLQHKDGSYRWILARGAAVRNDDGKPYRMVGSHIDITQSKLAEDALRSYTAKLMAVQRIQEYIRPRSSPLIPGFDIAGSLYPAEFAAGDHFDYLPMKERAVGIVVGDVSGHGFDSAISMTSVHSYMRLLVTLHDRIEDILIHVNALLSQEFEQGRYVTMFFARLNPATRLLSYVNAGHPAGYILDRNGRLKSEMASTAFPLGMFADARIPSSTDVMLEAGDIVLLMTDGVLEAESSGEVAFGVERALEVVRTNHKRTAKEISAALHDAVCHYIGHTTFNDDLTIVVIKATP